MGLPSPLALVYQLTAQTEKLVSNADAAPQVLGHPVYTGYALQLNDSFDLVATLLHKPAQFVLFMF